MGYKFKNKICVIYRENIELIRASMRYLRWFYGTIYKIPMDIFKEKEFTKASLINNGVCNYIMIFLLSTITGEEQSNDTVNKLLEVEQKIPLVTFYRAPEALTENRDLEHFFNIKFINEEEHLLRDVSFTDDSLGLKVKHPSTKDHITGYNSLNDRDRFVFVKPIRPSKAYQPLMACHGRTTASQFGLNIYIGQRGIAIPREDRALELDRPIYFLRLLNNLLKKSPAGYVRLKPSNWPVVLRIDDPPTNWQLLSQKRTILTPKDYAKIINILEKHSAKITCFVTPTCVSKDGKIKTWTETEYGDAKATLRILRDGTKKGAINIGNHGLTHLTIGYKPPSITTLILSKVGLVNHNLAREFYDSKLRKEIPYELQKKQLEESIKLIEEIFGFKPKAFSPPAHVWDDSTEKAVRELGIQYFSADMNFYLYPEGHDFRKNPSPLGEIACDSELLHVSATILGNYGTFRKTLKLFNELGVPLVWQQHNFQPHCFTPETLESFFQDIELFGDKAYMTISELGNLLRTYKQIKKHATLSSGHVECEIETEIPILIEAYYNGKTQSKEIAAGHQRIELDL